MGDQSDFYKKLVDEMQDGVYFVDRDRSITYWNKAAETISGHAGEKVLGRWCGDGLLVHVDGAGRELCGTGCPLTATMQDGLPRDCEAFLLHKQGHRVAVRVRASPIRNDEGEIVGAVEVFDDNAQRLASRDRIAELERAALLDPLTELGNRRFAEMQVRTRLNEWDRDRRAFGLLFFDIDHFKRVNDTHGHETGDRLLLVVARTTQAALRRYDVVCRWGGDEFLALVSHVQRPQLAAVAEKIRALAAASQLALPDDTVRTTLSIGAVVCHVDDDAESIVNRADRLMYASKGAGGNRATIESEEA